MIDTMFSVILRKYEKMLCKIIPQLLQTFQSLIQMAIIMLSFFLNDSLEAFVLVPLDISSWYITSHI